jgi:hypothetical protein
MVFTSPGEAQAPVVQTRPGAAQAPVEKTRQGAAQDSSVTNVEIQVQHRPL